MAGSHVPGPIGLSGKVADLDDGTLFRGLSPIPGPVGTGATGPERLQTARGFDSEVEWLFRSLRSVANSDELQRVVVSLLGPQCFSAGVIAGIGADILSSVADLLKLVVKLVLADLHDIATGEAHWSRYLNPTVGPRLIVAKVAKNFFGSELQHAAAERDALVRELSAAFQDPKAAFEGLADSVIAGYQNDWQDFKTSLGREITPGGFRPGTVPTNSPTLPFGG